MNFCYSLNCFTLVSSTKFWYFFCKICIWHCHIQMLHKKYQIFCWGHLSRVKRNFHSKQSPGSALLYIILIDVPTILPSNNTHQATIHVTHQKKNPQNLNAIFSDILSNRFVGLWIFYFTIPILYNP